MLVEVQPPVPCPSLATHHTAAAPARASCQMQTQARAYTQHSAPLAATWLITNTSPGPRLAGPHASLAPPACKSWRSSFLPILPRRLQHIPNARPAPVSPQNGLQVMAPFNYLYCHQAATLLRTFTVGDEMVMAAALLFTRCADLDHSITALSEALSNDASTDGLHHALGWWVGWGTGWCGGWEVGGRGCGGWEGALAVEGRVDGQSLHHALGCGCVGGRGVRGLG